MSKLNCIIGSMEPQPIGTAVILQNPQGQVLLGKRQGGYKAGLYGLPGGRIDQHEKAVTAAKRELAEETGVEAAELIYQGVIKEQQAGYIFIHFVFVCRKWVGDISNCEPEKCEGWEWFNLDSLPTELLPGHAAALLLLEENLASNLIDC